MLPRHDVPRRHTRHHARTRSATRRAPRATQLLLAALLLCVRPTTAEATTTVPLNTGYNHSPFVLYPPFSSPGVVADNYWINIASYPTTNPAIGPSWVLPQGAW